MTQLGFPVGLMFAFITIFFLPGEAVNPWFGEKLQYKCHCQNNKCTPTGQCTRGYRCERGWFGPECQYVDLAAKIKYPPISDAYIVTDGKDNTCVPLSTNSVTITLDKVYPFTWMRVYSAGCYDVEINMSPLQPTGCLKLHDPSGFLDYYCDNSGGVSRMTLKGLCTYFFLCSIYVSGGRNVALKGNTSQSGTYKEEGVAYGPDRSVDGNTNGDILTGRSCSHTEIKFDSNHWWKVTFNYPTKIYRYVIYNRLDFNEAERRLKGFHLETVDKAGKLIFKHVDNKAEVQNVSEIVDFSSSRPAAATTIKTYKVTTLNLCEVEIYGDTMCAVGFYGRECKQRCSTNCNKGRCYPSTGGCSAGCKPGFTGISCKEKF